MVKNRQYRPVESYIVYPTYIGFVEPSLKEGEDYVSDLFRLMFLMCGCDSNINNDY
jgi:hypothetical protein